MFGFFKKLFTKNNEVTIPDEVTTIELVTTDAVIKAGDEVIEAANDVAQAIREAEVVWLDGQATIRPKSSEVA